MLVLFRSSPFWDSWFVLFDQGFLYDNPSAVLIVWRSWKLLMFQTFMIPLESNERITGWFFGQYTEFKDSSCPTSLATGY